MKGAFATRIAGSADLYNTNARKPYHSVNFVIAHDGFSLYDLVAYRWGWGGGSGGWRLGAGAGAALRAGPGAGQGWEAGAVAFGADRQCWGP